MHVNMEGNVLYSFKHLLWEDCSSISLGFFEIEKLMLLVVVYKI
jgi:hypothetical protein